MTITNAFAGLAVQDLERSTAWYETLLGKGRRPMPEIVEWQFAGGGGLQLYRGPERAGQGSCTMIVDDIDEVAERLRSSGLAADAQPVHHDAVDTVMVKDPDGNSIAFAKPKDPSLIR